MAKPPKCNVNIEEQGGHARKTCTFEYLGVGNLASPADTKDVEEEEHFELLFSVGRACFSAIEESADYALVVYCHLGCCQLSVRW